MKFKQFIPVIVGLVAIILVWIIARWLKGRNAIEEIKKDVNQSRLSYADAQYYVFADAIQAATQSIWGDDEEAIYDVFSKMLNDDDVKMLMVAFGNRSYFAGSGWFYNAALNEVLHTVLSDSEILHINEILAINNVTITI